jgi:adenylosuccinate lyase
MPNTLTALSPLDGRYATITAPFRPYCSEFALIKYRLTVEIRWFQHLANCKKITQLPPLDQTTIDFLEKIITDFDESDAEKIKAIESKINHDIKAVEYFLKEKFEENSALKPHKEWIHFAATSADINNLAYALMLKDLQQQLIVPTLQTVQTHLAQLAKRWADKPLLARTHGQPASPTTVGKEFANFSSRLREITHQILEVKITGKCNGATGNYNAHHLAYPALDWPMITKTFVEGLALTFNPYTTQIEPHDHLAALFHAISRANTLLIGLCQDIWCYISRDFFSLKKQSTDVGSSTMPHKVNPIDFENAEGNLGLANALLQHMANKLPISRLQRDLSDSTVMRNIGSALAYAFIAYQAIIKGCNKLTLNEAKTTDELNQHWEVLAEALQTLMRVHHIDQPYEKLKALTHGKTLTQETLHHFIDTLTLPDDVKQSLKQLTPAHYLGFAKQLAEDL